MSIMLAMMHDKKLFDYDDKVVKHWPEFAPNQKENIKISDILRHEAGLHRLWKAMDMEWLTTDAIKKNVMGAVIEQDK